MPAHSDGVVTTFAFRLFASPLTRHYLITTQSAVRLPLPIAVDGRLAGPGRVGGADRADKHHRLPPSVSMVSVVSDSRTQIPFLLSVTVPLPLSTSTAAATRGRANAETTRSIRMTAILKTNPLTEPRFSGFKDFQDFDSQSAGVGCAPYPC